MNIAHLLPYSAQFPLKKHNGRYEWALRLAREQAKQGHTVTIYAAPNSSDASPILWQSIPRSEGDKKQDNAALLTRALTSPEHDIFHSHFDSLHYSLAHLTSKPIVCTQHWFPDEKIAGAARQFNGSNVHVVPVTHFMEREDTKLGIRMEKMIHHGIDLSLFTPTNGPHARLIFIGRITPGKGVKEAVELAQKTGNDLDIVGKVNDADREYWNSILPHVDGEHIRYLGVQPQEKVAELFSQARAFLFPNRHEEAFGQVIIESQASGTPVIASRTGTSDELIQNGETGFICETEQEFVEALNRVESIDRKACRTFAKDFDIQTMFDQYEALYRSLV